MKVEIYMKQNRNIKEKPIEKNNNNYYNNIGNAYSNANKFIA